MSFWHPSVNDGNPEKGPQAPADEENRVLDKLAGKVVEKGMTVPAIIFLESVKPLNFIGSQAMVFFEPMVQTLFNTHDYDIVRQALEKRETIENLLLKIEAADATAMAREKRIKAFYKVEKKKWKWYQRYLGLFPPKVKLPDEVLNGPPAPPAAPAPPEKK
ncbi:MAG: hypothetical protein WAU88_10750 [Candidatus Zixiibacteriota bacterium]